jgi:hypothetical protein
LVIIQCFILKAQEKWYISKRERKEEEREKRKEREI